jgi:hypothetical protein
MRRKTKLLAAVLAAALAAASLTSCDSIGGSKKATFMAEDGSRAAYPLADISHSAKAIYATELADGGGLLPDVTVPLPVTTRETQRVMFGGGDGSDAETVKWAAVAGCGKDGAPIDMLSFVPKVNYSKNPLIAILPTEDDVSAGATATPLDLLGYTLGCSMYVTGDENNMYIDTSSLVEGGSMAAAMSGTGFGNAKVRVMEMNGTKALPITSVDAETGLMRGLAKGGLYSFKLYTGSDTATTAARADTLVLTERAGGATALKYTPSEAGYYFVDTSKLEDGYYLIAPFGQVVQVAAG